MRILSGLRMALVALAATVGASSLAHADSGRVYISVVKGGWVIGGVSWGLVFGASKADLVGRVSNIRYPSDVAGVYGAAGAGAAVGVGARAIVLRNEKGAVLELTGRQVGLIADLDLSGLAISLR